MIIENNVNNELIINKSRFITYLYIVYSLDDFNKYYKLLKNKYNDATHICYAYIINNNIKFNDDKEPTGSAGIPIYNVLLKNNINYIACFVIRYFGGIKLGKSGLIRAYSNATSECLKKTTIIEYQKLIKIKIITNYQNIKAIESIIDKNNVIDINYDNFITYIVLIKEKDIEVLKQLNINYSIFN